MGIQVTIEFTTGSYEYQVLKGDADFDESFEDNPEALELVERLHNSTTYDEREEIAEELWEECGYDNAARILYPEGQLEVTYKKSDEEDINDLSYEILDNDWVEFDEFFEDDIKKSSFCIIKNSFAKRAHYYLKTELDEPFSGEYLKIANGRISYKDEELEFTGDAGGWFEEEGVYVFGSDEIEEEEEKIRQEEDETQDLYQTLRDKVAELLKDEIAAYEKGRNELNEWESAELFSAWKAAGIQDKGEKDWENLEWETKNYIFTYEDESKMEKMKEKGQTDSQKYKDLQDLQDKTKTWQTCEDLIRKKYRCRSYKLNDPHTWEVVCKYRDCEDLDKIKSWNQSTRKEILERQSIVDKLKKERDDKKMQKHISFGYGVSGAYWDQHCEESVAWETDEWFAIALDYHFHIEQHMLSIGQGDFGFRGKDSDENTRRIQEWCDAMQEIDQEYDRKIDAIVSAVEY